MKSVETLENIINQHSLTSKELTAIKRAMQGLQYIEEHCSLNEFDRYILEQEK
jgi:hypothetical protein